MPCYTIHNDWRLISLFDQLTPARTVPVALGPGMHFHRVRIVGPDAPLIVPGNEYVLVRPFVSEAGPVTLAAFNMGLADPKVCGIDENAPHGSCITLRPFHHLGTANGDESIIMLTLAWLLITIAPVIEHEV